jgi:hypothetical protein
MAADSRACALCGFAVGLVGATLGEPVGELASQEAPLASDLGGGDVAATDELGERPGLDAEEVGRRGKVEDFAGGILGGSRRPIRHAPER